MTVAVVAVFVAVVLALCNRAAIAAWSDWAANVVTVLGLCVSFVGFGLTLVTMLDTQQISREAQERIEEAARHAEEAVERAQEETRRAIQGIATHVRSADCAALGRWLRDMRQAAFDTRWQRALYRAQECQWLAHRLSYDTSLHPGEALGLEEGARNLLNVQRFIEEERMQGQPGGLDNTHIGHLDTLIALLETMEGRLLHQSMEVHHDTE